MVSALSAIFWGILTFSILVLLHEGGHFATARAFGVHVHEFMIGLPGPAIRWHGAKTTYGITAIPLGGYVRISGMEPGPEDELLGPVLATVTRLGTVNANDISTMLGIDIGRAESVLITLADWNAIEQVVGEEYTYTSKFPAEMADDPVALLDTARSTTYRALSTWKRVVVLSAGVAVNLVAALLVFVLLLTLYGVYRQTLTIDVTAKGSGAEAAGLVHGDTIKALDGKQLGDWDALITTLAASKPGETVNVVVVRDGAERTVAIKLGDAGGGKARLGIVVEQQRVRESLGQAFKESFSYVGMVFKAIGGFFNPATFKTSVSQSSSVIGVSVEVSRAVKQGPAYYAFILAVLSLSLGVLNILPIPPLDGGKIAIELVERAVGKPLPRNFSLGLSAAGTLFLFAFIGYLMYSDVVRYVVRGG